MFYEFKNQTEESNDLYIYGDIVSEKEADWWTGEVSENDVDLKTFKESVENLKDGQTLNMYINSGGGSVFAASAMVSMLQRSQERGVKITAYVDGLAGSAASLFPMVADETHLYKNSMLMIHKPLVGLIGYYNGADLKKTMDELDSIENGVLIPLYEARSSLSHQQIKNLVAAETWMNAQQIVDTFNGFTLHDETKNAAACASDCFKNYLHTPSEFMKAEKKAEMPKVENFDYSEFENKLNLISERK